MEELMRLMEKTQVKDPEDILIELMEKTEINDSDENWGELMNAIKTSENLIESGFKENEVKDFLKKTERRYRRMIGAVKFDGRKREDKKIIKGLRMFFEITDNKLRVEIANELDELLMDYVNEVS